MLKLPRNCCSFCAYDYLKKKKMRAYKAARDQKQPKRQIAAKKRSVPCGKRLHNNMTLSIIQRQEAVISILYANLCGVSRIVIIRMKKNRAILPYFCLFSVCRNCFCPFHTLYVYATLV